MDTMDTTSDNIAVVVPPLPLDIDAYHPFDEVYRHTVDEILSDEASFRSNSSSFNEYTGSVGDDGDELKPPALPKGRGDVRARLSGKKKSPYFSGNSDAGVKGKAAVAQREITRVDLSESETSPEPEPESVSGKQNEGVVALENGHSGVEMGPNPEFVAQVDGVDEISLEEEEDNPLASLGTDEQAQLNEFLRSHPFLNNSAYPVGRYARRQFVNELREKAGALGMNEHNIKQLIICLKNLYLETWAVGHVIFNNPENSEFGDEYDDKEEMTRRERRRKRRSGDKPKDKSKNKKSKRKSSEAKEIAIAPEEVKHEVVNIEDTAPTFRVDDDDLRAILVDLDNQTEDHTAPEPAKFNRHSSEKTKRRRHIDLGSQDDPIPLYDEIVEDECDSPTANIKESDIKHSTPAVSPVKQTNGSSNLNGGGHVAQKVSGLRDHPISLDDDDNGSKKDTGKEEANNKDASKKAASKKDANKKDTGQKDVNKKGAEKRTNQIPLDPTAAKIEKNKRKRQRRKQRRASYRGQLQSDAQPENSLQENGKETLEKYKLLDDPFWDL